MLALEPQNRQNPGVSLSKRLWDLARSNITDFTEGLTRSEDEDVLSEEERRSIDEELKAESQASRAGRGVRRGADRVKDNAERAWERAYESAQHRGWKGSSSGKGGPPSPAEERKRWYRTLELEDGADFSEVRSSYRRLLSLYHPDRFEGQTEKQKSANELTLRITSAYNNIKKYHR